MPEKIEIQTLTKIKKAKRGSLFFIDDFIRFANTKAVNKALEWLVEKGEVSGNTALRIIPSSHFS